MSTTIGIDRLQNLMLYCQQPVDLKELKARYSEEQLKRAYNHLTSAQKERVKATAQGRYCDHYIYVGENLDLKENYSGILKLEGEDLDAPFVELRTEDGRLTPLIHLDDLEAVP